MDNEEQISGIGPLEVAGDHTVNRMSYSRYNVPGTQYPLAGRGIPPKR